MDTVEVIARSLEQYLLDLNDAEGRLRLLCPDGQVEIAGTFNLKKLARAGALAVHEALIMEREACARICEGVHATGTPHDRYQQGLAEGSNATAAMLARMIRARGPLPDEDVEEGEDYTPASRPEARQLGPCPNTWWP
jgi:hypothetical protein